MQLQRPLPPDTRNEQDQAVETLNFQKNTAHLNETPLTKMAREEKHSCVAVVASVVVEVIIVAHQFSEHRFQMLFAANSNNTDNRTTHNNCCNTTKLDNAY